ncbi:hypothetical protein, partial [Dyella silvatica]|uniref:hypothetical protein n=1 Tax=Dyella silvatica TaxID=2992128 RepID=UPI00224D3207
MRFSKLAFCLAAVLAIPGLSAAADSKSTYAEVSTDISIGASDAIALTSTFSLTTPSWVYLQSDGRAFPNAGPAIADIWMTADGNTVSNGSVIDWSTSLSPQQHSFNTIGAVFLQAGTHTVALHARSLNSSGYTLGANSNLSVLVNPATAVGVASLAADTGVLSYNVNGLNSQSSVIPIQAQATANINGSDGSTLVALASSRIFRWGN